MNKYGKNLLCYFQLQHFIVFFVSSSGFLLARTSWTDFASILQRQNRLGSPVFVVISAVERHSIAVNIRDFATALDACAVDGEMRDLSGSAMNGQICIR